MSKKLIIVTIFGVVTALLGLLWFLQGAEIIHLNPILCVSNCEPLTGKSLLWQIVGAATFLAGIFTVVVCARRVRRHRKN